MGEGKKAGVRSWVLWEGGHSSSQLELLRPALLILISALLTTLMDYALKIVLKAQLFCQRLLAFP